MKTVLCDADGVLFHFTKTFLEFFGHDVSVEADIDQFDIVKALAGRLPADAYRQFGEAIGRLNVCSTIPAYAGAADFVAAMQAAGYVVHACTTPFNADWLSQRSRALDRLGIPLKRQIHCSNKALVRGDVLIDDNWQHCHDFVNATQHDYFEGGYVHVRRRAFLFDRPWNQSEILSGDVTRHRSYESILRQLGCL